MANRYEWYWKAVASELSGPAIMPHTPSKELSPDMLRGFSMDGRVPVEMAWGDVTCPINHPLIYRDEQTDAYLARIGRGESSIYGDTDTWLREAFDKHPIVGKTIAVMGSNTQWYGQCASIIALYRQ